MRLLHNLTGITKIFKYQDFTDNPSTAEPADIPAPHDEPFQFEKLSTPDISPPDDEPLIPETPLSSGIPYVTFNDEDLKRNEKKPKQEIIIEAKREEAGDEEVISQEELMLEDARQKAKAILEQAKADADEMLSEAEVKALQLHDAASKEGYQRGYEQGLEEGRKDGEEQAFLAADKKYRDLFDAVDEACINIEMQKQELLHRHLDDLSELTLTIAEKVIHVALESCGEVIKRMIVSAAAPAVDKQWAKVMISSKDAEMMKADEIDIKGALGAISGRVSLIIVEDAPQGTCLIEFPDQAVDAGAGTQLKNIKDIVRNAERD